MRRRTADFLQGNSISNGTRIIKLTFTSPSKSTTRKRRKREEDSQWTHFQGSRKLRGLLKIIGRFKNTKYKITMSIPSRHSNNNACDQILEISSNSCSKAHSPPACLATVVLIHARVHTTTRTASC